MKLNTNFNTMNNDTICQILFATCGCFEAKKFATICDNFDLKIDEFFLSLEYDRTQNEQRKMWNIVFDNGMVIRYWLA